MILESWRIRIVRVVEMLLFRDIERKLPFFLCFSF